MNSLGLNNELQDSDILLRERYLGYTFLVMANRSMGIRNGYVRLPRSHPYNRLFKNGQAAPNPVKLEDLLHDRPCGAVLGGITFCSRAPQSDNYWLGFTTADGNYKADLDLFTGGPDLRTFYIQINKARLGSGRIWTTEMVAEKCRHLVELLLVEASLSPKRVASINWTSPTAVRILRERAQHSLTL